MGLEYFLNDRISSLRYLASAHTYASLVDPQSLRGIFQKRKQEFPELIDLGSSMRMGCACRMQARTPKRGKTMRNRTGCQGKVHGVAVSQVFPGDRNLLHYVVAVRQYVPKGIVSGFSRHRST